MDAQVVPFVFENHPVRSVVIDGEPWFVAVDVCAALELAQVSRALSRLDDEDKFQVLDYATLTNSTGRENQQHSAFDPKAVNVINESGVYNLIFTSRKDSARKFKRWVTSEVLPSLRKHGVYRIDSAEIEEALQLTARVKSAEGALLLTEAAKALGVGPFKLRDWLVQHGWIYRRGRKGRLLAKQDKIDAGLLDHNAEVVTFEDSRELVTTQVLVTPKGLAKLAGLAKASFSPRKNCLQT